MENYILKELLTDQTKKQMLRSLHGVSAYIIWATDDYSSRGEDYQFAKPILPKLISGDNEDVIIPRVRKTKEQQGKRSKGKAEVFTPSWVCNAQNNLVDEAWFGRKDVFNTENNTNGTHAWTPTKEKISFEGTGKTWQDYILDTRLEITCGEAPYLVSRYDTTNGISLPIPQRIGLLDRKLRVIGENVTSMEEWIVWAKVAYQNTYGFEWQGDNLYLARLNLYNTFLDYFEAFKKQIGESLVLSPNTLLTFANIISWNIWQMDGLKFVIPMSCTPSKVCTNQKEIDKAMRDPYRQMFPDEAAPLPQPIYKECECIGCATGDRLKHTGIYAKIRNWKSYNAGYTEDCDLRFVDMLDKM